MSTVTFLLFVMIQQSFVDSTTNRSVSYQNLNYELPGLGFHATFDQNTGDIYLFHGENRTPITISEAGNVDTTVTIYPGHEALDKMGITHLGESIYFSRVIHQEIMSGARLYFAKASYSRRREKSGGRVPDVL